MLLRSIIIVPCIYPYVYTIYLNSYRLIIYNYDYNYIVYDLYKHIIVEW